MLCYVKEARYKKATYCICSFIKMYRIGKSMLCELHLNFKNAKEIITLPHNPSSTLALVSLND